MTSDIFVKKPAFLPAVAVNKLIVHSLDQFFFLHFLLATVAVGAPFMVFVAAGMRPPVGILRLFLPVPFA